MITAIASEHAGALTSLILDCQTFPVKLYNPYFSTNKYTSDSGLYNIACETKHTHCDGSIIGILKKLTWKSLVLFSKTNGFIISLNEHYKKHMSNATE